MAISWNSSGIRCRKWNESGTACNPEQIAIINNNIVFTDDNWATAKMAIGHFKDTNLGDIWGVIAPNIVGTLLAGHNLVIESQKKDGDISVFRVDADGAVLHNARFDIENGISHIVLDPTLGFGIGDYPIINQESTWDETNAKFWVDINGDVHFKGTLEGCDGLFNGSLLVGGETGFRVDKMGNLSIGGTASNPNFHVSSDGIMQAKGGEFSGTVDVSILRINGQDALTDDFKIKSGYLDLGNIQLNGETGDITLTGNINLSNGKIIWGNNSPVQYQFSINGTSNWHSTMQSTDKYRRDSLDGGITWGAAYQFRGTDGQDGQDGSDANVPGYIKSTYIDMTMVASPYIKANILEIQAPDNNGTNGILLTGYYDHTKYDWLQIHYYEGNGPYLHFDSPDGAFAYWDFSTTRFTGRLDFNNAVIDWGGNQPTAVFA